MGPAPMWEPPVGCFGSCCLARERCTEKPSKAPPPQVLANNKPLKLKGCYQEAQDTDESALEGPAGQLRKTKLVAAVASAALLAAAVGGPPASFVWAGGASKAVLGMVPIIASLAWATTALLANKSPSACDRQLLGEDDEPLDSASIKVSTEFLFPDMDADEIKAAKWHQRRQEQALSALSTLEAQLKLADLEDPEGFLNNKLTLLRYLRACNAAPDMPVTAHAEAALCRLRQTLAWRKEVLLQGSFVSRTKIAGDLKRYRFSCQCCRDNPNAHCYFPLGSDRRQRLVVYSCAARADNADLSGVGHIISELEANLGEKSAFGAEQIVWVVDFRGFHPRHADPRVGIEAIKAFSKHYPERLGQVVLLGFPAAFHFLYQLLFAVVDPVTKQKIRILRRPEEREAYVKKYWPDWMQTWLEAADALPPIPSAVLPALPGGSGDPRVTTPSRAA